MFKHLASTLAPFAAFAFLIDRPCMFSIGRSVVVGVVDRVTVGRRS